MSTMNDSKAALEEQEVQEGIRKNIRQFSVGIAVSQPQSSLASYLELATEREERQRSRPWRRCYEDEDALPV